MIVEVVLLLLTSASCYQSCANGLETCVRRADDDVKSCYSQAQNICGNDVGCFTHKAANCRLLFSTSAEQCNLAAQSCGNSCGKVSPSYGSSLHYGSKKLDEEEEREEKEKAEKAEECKEAKKNAIEKAQELATRANKLKRCGETEDLSNDCSYEYRGVKNAWEDYEHALQEVEDKCDE